MVELRTGILLVFELIETANVAPEPPWTVPVGPPVLSRISCTVMLPFPVYNPILFITVLTIDPVPFTTTSI